MIIRKQNHKIIPRLGGLFTVVNERSNQRYLTDIYLPSCTCPAFKFNKRNSNGKKLECKHITLAKGLVEVKG